MKTNTETRSRSNYHHGDLRNALINTALAQIANHGARALSLREVARATGVSHASTYRHFRNKESLLASIAEQGFLNLTAAMQAAARPHTRDPLAMLRATGIAYVDFGVSYPHHLQVMFGDVIVCHDDYPTLMEASKAAYDVLASTVSAGQRAGCVRSQSERTVALAAWSLVHGLALLIASGRIRSENGGQLAHKALAASLVTLLQEGLSPTPTADARPAALETRQPRRRKSGH